MIINLEYETRLKLSIKMIPSLIYAAPRTKTCYACGRAMHGKSMFGRICTYRYVSFPKCFASSERKKIENGQH